MTLDDSFCEANMTNLAAFATSKSKICLSRCNVNGLAVWAVLYGINDPFSARFPRSLLGSTRTGRHPLREYFVGDRDPIAKVNQYVRCIYLNITSYGVSWPLLMCLALSRHRKVKGHRGENRVKEKGATGGGRKILLKKTDRALGGQTTDEIARVGRLIQGGQKKFLPEVKTPSKIGIFPPFKVLFYTLRL